MTKEFKIRFLRIYRILLGIVIVIAGICLITGCLDIYNSGDQPFSRESVAEEFSQIAIPVFLCLGMTFLGFVLELFISIPASKPTIEKPYAHLLKRLYVNRDLSQCDENTQHAIAQLQKKRKSLFLIHALILVVTSVIFLVYALNGNNFHKSDINNSMIGAMKVLLPCLAVAFVSSCVVAFYHPRSLQKEIELVKQLPISDTPQNTTSADASKLLNIVRCAILAVSIVLVVAGFLTGGAMDVLGKAARICTECIGLG